MKRLPSIRELHYLLALHSFQHFGRAAKACFVSQSTLSTAILELEEILDTQLLERDHKTFLFTPLGEELVIKSRKVIEEIEELIDFAKFQGKPMTGSLRLGCIPTIAPFILEAIISIAREEYPKLELFIREDTTNNLLKALTEGKIDLLLLALPYPIGAFHIEILAHDPFQLVLHNNLLKKKVTNSINTWPDESIFLLEQEHCLTNQALQGCSISDQNKIHPFFATSLHTLTQMVNSQEGITFLPQMAINSGILKNTELSYQPPANKNAHRKIGLAWRFTSHKEATFQQLGQLIKKILITQCSDTNFKF